VTVERRDRLGRRIGENWWREWVTSQYHPAREAWELRFETEANRTWRPGLIAREKRRERRGGRREVTDFCEQHPPVTFKQFLLSLAGSRPDEEAA
jgi:hypothetical protein